MKKILLSFAFFCAALTGAYAQVGIGTDTPDQAAQLDITADPNGDKGLLIPRVELTGITAPLGTFAPADMPNSLIVFNTKKFTDGGKDYNVGYYYWATDDSTATHGPGKWVPILAATPDVISNFFNTLNTSTVVYDRLSNTLNVNVGNGLKQIDNKIGLGGQLDVDTEIKFNGNELAFSGVQTTTAAANFLVMDGSGNIRNLEKLDANVLSSTGTLSSTTDVLVITNGTGAVLTDVTVGIKSNSITGDLLSKTAISLEGDVTGDLTSTTISKIQGKTVSATNPAIKEALVFDGNAWVPTAIDAAISTGTLTSTTDVLVITNGAGAVLTDVTVGIKSNSITGDLLSKTAISLEGDVTGDLTSTTISKIQGATLSTTNAQTGDVLVYDATPGNEKWEAKKLDAESIEGKDLTVGEGLVASGTTTATVLKEFGLAVKAGNGITVDADGVNLGGTLSKTATLTTSDAAAFVIDGAAASATNIQFKDLPDAGTVSATDKVLITDANGRVKSADINFAKINYTSVAQNTGRKWTLGGANKEVKEITLDVTFPAKSTKVDVTGVMPNSGNVTVIGIRLVGKPGATTAGVPQINSISTNATYRYQYDAADGQGPRDWIFIGTGQKVFSTSLLGEYYVIVEYFEN